MASATHKGPVPPTNPPNKGGTKDQRKHFTDLTAETPVDTRLRTAFIKSKLRLAYTHPASKVAGREAAVKNIVDLLGSNVIMASVEDMPVPGGVGYGVFFTPVFQSAWGQGTSLKWDIACPTPPGGNVNTFLYLTSTNRSGLGVEALISYNGQNDTHFMVFDWSRTNANWQTNVPLSGLTPYLTTENANGNPYQILSVWNTTSYLGASEYWNEVRLYNYERGGWDIVYDYDYTATDAQQKNSYVGSWGPIVETFQSVYNQTSPMGALNIELASADNEGAWGDWAPITPPNTYIRNDNVGFQLVFLDPNYSFTVTS
jgi:hypothetical protein